MITSRDLERCINYLAQISNGASQDVRQKAVEIGYILKKELDVVVGIEQMNAEIPSQRHLDMKGLINDNVQLFNENRKLIDENVQLKSILESRVNSITSKMSEIYRDVMEVNNNISSLRM